MTRPATLAPTPGAYLKMRRQAAGFSLADVAALLHTEPHGTPEHQRIEQLQLIEADVLGMTLTTIVALRQVFCFDQQVLWTLEELRQGNTDLVPRLCRICACSDLDACANAFHINCHWVESDLCSAHALPIATSAIAA